MDRREFAVWPPSAKCLDARGVAGAPGRDIPVKKAAPFTKPNTHQGWKFGPSGDCQAVVCVVVNATRRF